MKAFCSELKKTLSKELPGIKSQLKLAPESRNLFQIEEIKIDAAILILLYIDTDNNLSTVLMKRPSYDGHHSGQISFPGGKTEEEDRSMEDTALRESMEEIGIITSEVEILGKLTELYIPVSNFLVHPYIGFLDKTPDFKLDKKEVDYLILTSIEKLINAPISYTTKRIKENEYKIPFYDINGEVVWGATAMIISELIEVLKKQLHLID